MVLNIDNLTGGYSKTAVIHDINFDIRSGEIVGLIGLNGSGKSTTIKHILGLLNPHKGSIKVNDIQIDEDTEKYRRDLAYIPESPILYEELTLKEHINMTAMAYGLDEQVAWKRAEKLLKVFRLDDKVSMFPTHFSKGMKQKVMLICAFMVEPDLYIIDEPFLGLDPLGIESLIDLMVEERDENRSILMSTHILSTAERYCNRYVILDNGRVLVSGTIEELRQKMEMPDASLDDLYLSLTGGAGSNESTSV